MQTNVYLLYSYPPACIDFVRLLLKCAFRLEIGLLVFDCNEKTEGVVCRLTLFWCHKEGENRTIKMMLHGTIRNDDFLRNEA